MTSSETRYAETSDHCFIAYRTIGSGSVNVAYVGSLPTQVEVLFEFEPCARFWRDLSTSTRVIVHDRRGSGLSDRRVGLANIETRANDLLAVLDSSGSATAVMFGTGDGGMVGAFLAAYYPERVAGFIWYQAAARCIRGPHWPYGDQPLSDRSLAEASREWGTQESIERQFGGQRPLPQDLTLWIAKMQRHFCGPGDSEQFLRLYEEGDVREILPDIHVPTLVLDPAEPHDPSWRGMAEATADLIPGASLVRVAGTHFLWEHAEERIAIVNHFIGVWDAPINRP